MSSDLAPIKVLTNTICDSVDREYHVREIHAGFISRTEANLRELEELTGVKVSDNARVNMYGLLEGDMTLPWILLQNPTNTQEYSRVRSMIAYTPCLKNLENWIRLGNDELSLWDVPVVDVFPLVSDKMLANTRQKELVTDIVFRITMDLIWTYAPREIISMQCYSNGAFFGEERGGFYHDFARRLASSTELARSRDPRRKETISEQDVYAHLGSIQRDNYKSTRYQFNLTLSRHPAGLTRPNTRGERETPAEKEREIQRIINLLESRYSEHDVYSTASGPMGGENSLYACYMRILPEIQRRRQARSSPMSYGEIREKCLAGWRKLVPTQSTGLESYMQNLNL